MEKSQSIAALAKALMAFHAKVAKIRKDAVNPFFKKNYASLSNILEQINDPLIESGLTFSQFPTNGSCLTTIIIHAESGEYMQDTFEMKPVKDDPQGKGSVITYQRRYALAAILGLNIDDDDDGNLATHGAKEPAKQESPKSAKPKAADKAFKQAVERVNAGEHGVYEKMKAAFELTAYQDETLFEASKKLKNGNVHA